MWATLSPQVRKLVSGAVVGAGVGIVIAVLCLMRPMLFERGEWWTHDLRARSAADAKQASPDIVIVDISEQDIEDVYDHMDQSWPWPRALYAYLTEYFRMAGAKVVLYDWLFVDRGAHSVNDAEEFANAMKKAGNNVIGLALSRAARKQKPRGKWAAKLRTFPTRKQAMPVALKLMAWNSRAFLIGDGPVDLYYGGKKAKKDVTKSWERMKGIEEIETLFAAPSVKPEPRELTDAELATQFSIADFIAERDGIPKPPGTKINFPKSAGMTPPLDVIAPGPKHTANVIQRSEADGIMRRHAPLVEFDGRLYPSLALAGYLVGEPDAELIIKRDSVVLGWRRLPLDHQGKIAIRYHGNKLYEHIPAYEILRSYELVTEYKKPPSVPFDKLRGKYVFVSASGQALRDIRVTPVSNIHLGAEIQANMLDNLLNGDWVRRTSRGLDALVAFLLCLVMGIMVVAIWSAIPGVKIAFVATVTATLALLASYWWLAAWLYASEGVWIAVALPGGGGMATAFAALAVTSAAERRNKRFVQEALGRYTSPELADYLQEHPEHLSLEFGQTRRMSVYFSDIAGFTTMSEGLEPEQLVRLLNDYLTHMTDIVLESGGIVDKYIGDAVMAFWGAPVSDKNHAHHAVLCALAMRRKCDELRPIWEKEYGVTVNARAGVNSGKTVVGNMGSKHKYNYTVMGDMVNLAARLEGANKPYGTYLMISEFTLTEVEDIVDVRELDYLAVKGKNEPVRVFEVLEEAGKVPEVVARAMQEYEAGLTCYRDREFSAAIDKFESALEILPEDGPSKMYVERCKALLENPPEDDWDGVWRLKEK